MALNYLLDRVQVATATTGTGTVTLGAPVSPYQSFAAAGAVNGRVYAYLIQDTGGAWEIGYGTYNSSTPSMTRTLVSSSTGSLLNLSGTATISVVASVGTGTAAPTPVDYFTDPSVSNTKVVPQSGLSTASSTNSTVTLTTNPDRLVLSVGVATSGNQMGFLYQAYPSANFTLTVQFLSHVHPWNNNTQMWGLAVQDTTNKFFLQGDADVSAGSGSQGEFMIRTMPNINGAITTLSSSWWQSIPFSGGAPVWMKLQQTGGNFIWSYSSDGANWKVLNSQATSVVGTLSNVGFFFYNTSANLIAYYASIFSWTLTTP